MADQIAFQISDDSTVLTPEAPGVAVIAQALRLGMSIFSGQSSANPVVLKPDATQWLYCESSGSSGPPKVIRRRPESWISSFNVNARAFDLGATDSYAILGHLGHSLSLYATLEALHLGADLMVLAGQRPKSQAQMIAGASVIYATPAQLRLLCAGFAAAGMPPHPQLRRIFCGGGRLDPDLTMTLNQNFPNAQINVFFGASETSFITIGDTDTPAESVGRTYPGVTIDIRPLSGQHGPIGEIWVSSPYLFDGYERGASNDTQRDRAFLSIGELGQLDAHGYLFLKGRKNRMVTVADQNVFPEEIERVVMLDPAVTACVALPLKDAKRGHQIVCTVEAPPGDILDKRLRMACRAALGDASVPRHFLHLDTIPLLPAGKPDLQALRILVEARI